MNNESTIPLYAGAAEMFFEPDTGFLRRIRLGDREVIRCIYIAVRDHNWGTPKPRITNVRKTVGNDNFAITFESECKDRDVHFRWETSITGNHNGIVTVTFKGEALTTFRRNRIGLCILYPIRECAGTIARQTRTDGSVIECRFPETIEPQIVGQASFRDLQQLTHEVRPELWAEMTFDGEIFEMEDQRNWTDASFKVYGTPLADPFPVEVEKGTQIRQSVRLRFHPHQPGHPIEVNEPDIIRLPRESNARLPQIGTCLGEGEVAESMKPLKLAHLRVDIHPEKGSWRTDLRRGLELGLPLELTIHMPSSEQEFDVGEVARFCAEQSLSVTRVIALRKGEPATSNDTYEAIKRAFPNVRIGAGKNKRLI
ncbi:MAG: hypothetical protein ACI9R3_001821 [Verrucomicrobiales bacterium]|jgi:hypothetical protein